jgi:hypothetical protein
LESQLRAANIRIQALSSYNESHQDFVGYLLEDLSTVHEELALEKAMTRHPDAAAYDKLKKELDEMTTRSSKAEELLWNEQPLALIKTSELNSAHRLLGGSIILARQLNKCLSDSTTSISDLRQSVEQSKEQVTDQFHDDVENASETSKVLRTYIDTLLNDAPPNVARLVRGQREFNVAAGHVFVDRVVEPNRPVFDRIFTPEGDIPDECIRAVLPAGLVDFVVVPRHEAT